MPEIRIAETARDLAAVKTLFREYADFLGIDLCFQDFDREMATFPDFYDFVLLGLVDGEDAGAVGLKDKGGGRCEMKRLFVRRAFQGAGLGRALAEGLIAEARARRYRTMLLDTLPKLASAIALYRDLGFIETEKYYDNPGEGVLYMALPLEGER